MVTKRLAKLVFGSTVMTAVLFPSIALAEEAATTAGPWQSEMAKFLSAALAIGLSAFAAAYAQAKIGAAGAGTLAERPEERIWIITMEAIPEIIVLLGFVTALMIINK